MKAAWLEALTVSALLLLSGCVTGSDPDDPPSEGYRTLMREFVEAIGTWSGSIEPSFLIVPQNGNELITSDGEPDGTVVASYASAIDGMGREDLFFGYTSDDEATPASETEWMMSFLNIAAGYGKTVLVTDYCYTHWKMDSSYAWNSDAGYISFAADHRGLDNIPDHPFEPWNVNSNDVADLADAQNFLYLIDAGQFSSADEFISAVEATSYDLLIIDLFWNDQQLSAADVARLKVKENGGSRLVLAYMSIGEAEDYRYYWQSGWSGSPPGWLGAENPEWPGNYLVEYWNDDWQAIIFGSSDSYLGRIMDSGFDGVYLDKIDSYETWEDS